MDLVLWAEHHALVFHPWISHTHAQEIAECEVAFINTNKLFNEDINFIQNHPSGTQLEGSKNPLLGTKMGVQNPPLGHKVRKFHKYIYKL